jgi:DNA-binding transcriptional regulator PaaX
MNNKLQSRKIKTVTSPFMKATLYAATAAGLAGIVVVAPNAGEALELVMNQIDKSNKRKLRFKEQLKRSGYISVDDCGDGRYAITLTLRGNEAASNLLFEEYELTKKAKWDGNWHILTFDIGEQHKYLRDMLSNKATELGMLPIQNSVYVYPYKFDDFLDSLHAVYPDAMQYVLGMEASRIDGDKQLIEKFVQAGVI